MSYLPAVPFAPEPNDDDRGFWDCCNRQRLCFQGCQRCGTVVHPPLAVCPGCGGIEPRWIEAPAAARVYSCTWAHGVADESVRGRTPYNIVLVEFDGLPDVRLVSNVIDASYGELTIGAALRLVWEQGRDQQWLPRFALASGT